MFIQSNIEAMQSYLDMWRVDARFNKSLAKLSSGMELPKPMFGGGMYAVANDMEALYREYVMGAKNVQDAQGLMEVAQLAMMEVHEVLLSMNELAHRAATDTINSDQRDEMNVAFQRYKENIANVLLDVHFNELSLWTSTQIGMTFSIVFGENRQFRISTFSMGSVAFGYNGTTLSTQALGQVAMSQMQNAINYSCEILARMGAQIEEIEGKVNIINEQAVQEKAMESRINEIDYAKEMKNYMSLQVVLQASTAMVAQANMKGQMVMQLFG